MRRDLSTFKYAFCMEVHSITVARRKNKFKKKLKKKKKSSLAVNSRVAKGFDFAAL